jgi:hypothetical protein
MSNDWKPTDGLRNAFRQAMKDGVMDATPYLKQMTFNKEIELLKQEIKMLQSKLSFLDELEKTKSPVAEAYKEWWGQYPAIKENGDEWDDDDVRWDAFRYGWWAAQPKNVGVPECPDELEYDLKEGTAPPEPTPSAFRQKLFDGIKSVFYDPDYERTHWKMKVNMAVDEVLTHFYDILPEPQSAAGSQNVDVEFLVDGYNDCLNELKEKLR